MVENITGILEIDFTTQNFVKMESTLIFVFIVLLHNHQPRSPKRNAVFIFNLAITSGRVLMLNLFLTVGAKNCGAALDQYFFERGLAYRAESSGFAINFVLSRIVTPRFIDESISCNR